MPNLIDIKEYEILKHDFEALTAKHREVLHLVLFKVLKCITFFMSLMITYN